MSQKSLELPPRGSLARRPGLAQAAGPIGVMRFKPPALERLACRAIEHAERFRCRQRRGRAAHGLYPAPEWGEDLQAPAFLGADRGGGGEQIARELLRADAHAIEACGNLAGDVPVRRLGDLVPEYDLRLGLTRKLRDDPCRRPASQHEPRAGPCADRPQARLQGLQRLREPPARGAAWRTQMHRAAGLVKHVKADHRSPAL